MPERVADLDDLAARCAERALLHGDFVLRSGERSSRYFDKFLVSCDPELLRDVTVHLARLLRAAVPDAAQLAAPALGAVPLGTALALTTDLPLAIVRDTGKSYGTGRQIEGPVHSGAATVMVEDVVTSGGAVVAAVQTARDAGLDVRAALCLLDRGGGGRERLAELDVPLTSLFTLAHLEPPPR